MIRFGMYVVGAVGLGLLSGCTAGTGGITIDPITGVTGANRPILSGTITSDFAIPSPWPNGGTITASGPVGAQNVQLMAPQYAAPRYVYSAPAPCEEPMANSKTRAARR